jgi:hypothetical protein
MELADCKSEIRYFAELFPDQGNEFKHKHNFVIDSNLPYIFCGIDRNKLWAPGGCDEEINYKRHYTLPDAMTLVAKHLADIDTIISAKAAGLKRIKIIDLINEVKEKYPEFYELAADWLKERANSISINDSNVRELNNPDLLNTRFMVYLATKKLESVKSVNLSGLRGKPSEKIKGEQLKNILGSFTIKDGKYQISFVNIFGKQEKIGITPTRLKEVLTYIRTV